MITPSKFMPLDQTILCKSLFLLEEEFYPLELSALYQKFGNSYESIDEFILSIEMLWILGKINIDFGTGMVTYVG